MEYFKLIISLLTGIAATLVLKDKVQAYFYNKITWNKVNRAVENIILEINSENYNPDVIISIGRGGVILGSLLSANLKIEFTSMIYWDVIYEWEKDKRKNKLITNNLNQIKEKKILICVGNIFSGNSISEFLSEINSIEAQEIKIASITKSELCKTRVDFYGFLLNKRKVMPWIYNKKVKIKHFR